MSDWATDLKMMSTSEPSDDGYVLKRGFAASARLNLMHFIWKEHAGYVLHPRIAERIQPETVAVAEIGTGTGIWIVDLAKHLPSTARLDGFDISLQQCPPREWLPSNVTMSVLDSLGPVPDHLIGVYDVIHIRHFVLVVPNGDPSGVIANILKMLKPGGYIQWGEMDFTAARFVKAREESSTKAIEALQSYIGSVGKKSGDPLRKQTPWTAILDHTLKDNGMVNVTLDRIAYDDTYLSYQLDTALLTWEELVFMVIDRIGPEEGKKARELLALSYEEGRNGGAWTTERIVAIGQKPQVSATL